MDTYDYSQIFGYGLTNTDFTMKDPYGMDIMLSTHLELCNDDGHTMGDMKQEDLRLIKNKINNMLTGKNDKLVFRSDQDNDSYIMFSHNSHEHRITVYSLLAGRKTSNISILLKHHNFKLYLDTLLQWLDYNL